MKRSLKRFHDGKTGAAITLALQYGAKTAKIVNFQKDGTVIIALTNAAPGSQADNELMRFPCENAECGPKKSGSVGRKR